MTDSQGLHVTCSWHSCMAVHFLWLSGTLSVPLSKRLNWLTAFRTSYIVQPWFIPYSVHASDLESSQAYGREGREAGESPCWRGSDKDAVYGHGLQLAAGTNNLEVAA